MSSLFILSRQRRLRSRLFAWKLNINMNEIQAFLFLNVTSKNENIHHCGIRNEEKTNQIKNFLKVVEASARIMCPCLQMFSKHLGIRLFSDRSTTREKNTDVKVSDRIFPLSFCLCLLFNISQHWAICIIAKNRWAINFPALGNCPMAPPLDTPLSVINKNVINY